MGLESQEARVTDMDMVRAGCDGSELSRDPSRGPAVAGNGGEVTISEASRRASRPGREASSIEAMYRAHARDVFAAAYRVTGHAMDAEDALQTVFTRLQSPGARQRVPAAGLEQQRYLRRAAVNAALDILRGRRRRRIVALQSAAPRGGERGAPPGASDPDLGAVIRLTLAELPPRTAQMVALHYLEGFSHRAVGEILGTNANVVAVSLHRARGRLREAVAASLGETS